MPPISDDVGTYLISSLYSRTITNMTYNISYVSCVNPERIQILTWIRSLNFPDIMQRSKKCVAHYPVQSSMFWLNLQLIHTIRRWHDILVSRFARIKSSFVKPPCPLRVGTRVSRNSWSDIIAHLYNSSLNGSLCRKILGRDESTVLSTYVLTCITPH